MIEEIIYYKLSTSTTFEIGNYKNLVRDKDNYIIQKPYNTVRRSVTYDTEFPKVL